MAGDGEQPGHGEAGPEGWKNRLSDGTAERETYTAAGGRVEDEERGCCNRYQRAPGDAGEPERVDQQHAENRIHHTGSHVDPGHQPMFTGPFQQRGTGRIPDPDDHRDRKDLEDGDASGHLVGIASEPGMDQRIGQHDQAHRDRHDHRERQPRTLQEDLLQPRIAP